MANPKNTFSLTGVIKGIRPLKQKGVLFGVLMEIAVTREYRDRDGKYREDIIPVKYTFPDSSVKKFAEGLKCGEGVIVLGTIRTDLIVSGLCVYTSSISYDQLTMQKRFNPSQTVPQDPLPF